MLRPCPLNWKFDTCNKHLSHHYHLKKTGRGRSIEQRRSFNQLVIYLHDTLEASPAEHAADLLKEKTAQVIDSAQEKYGAAINEVSVRAMEATDAVRDYANQAADALDGSVKTRPMTTLAGALALGFLLGAIWKG